MAGFTEWVDGRIRVISATVLTQENLDKIRDTLMPVIDKLFHDGLDHLQKALVDALGTAVGQVLDHVTQQAQQLANDLQQVLAHGAEVNAKLVDEITNIIPGNLDDQVADGLANRIRDILKPPFFG